MTQEVLDGFVERVNRDTGFRERVLRNPAAALGEFGIRAGEQVALASNGEDVLRRMSSAHIQEDWFWTRVKRVLSRLFCGPGGTRSWECPKAP